MNILIRPEKAFVPVDQPTNFPRFYLIPETSTLQIPNPASNNPRYRQSPPTRIKPPQETKIQKFFRHEKEIFQEACADTWSAIKAFGRSVVRWLVWRIFVPLSVVCALSSQLVSPAELPL
jgi:hypothetical protein